MKIINFLVKEWKNNRMAFYAFFASLLVLYGGYLIYHGWVFINYFLIASGLFIMGEGIYINKKASEKMPELGDLIIKKWGIL